MNTQFIAAKRFFSEVKKTVYLYKNLWKEHTTALLHAPRETEKTATALSIASEIASKEREVLYINAEEHLDNCNVDAEGLYIFTPRFESIDDNRDYADLVFEAIEDAVRNTGIRTFVIDSVSRIAALSFGRNASAAYVMKRLVALQVKCRLSLLVVADDKAKAADRALHALADSEIKLNPEQKEEPKPTPAPTAPTPKPEPTSIFVPETALTPLTRQQRRALARKAAKRGVR